MYEGTKKPIESGSELEDVSEYFSVLVVIIQKTEK